MTISTTTSSVTYLGNGVTTSFTFSFVADEASDIDVYYTDTSGTITLLPTSAYTLVINVAPVGGLWGIGGTVTYPISGTPIQTGTSLSIIRSVPYTQDVSISNQGSFYPQAIEQGLDVLELQIQQIVNDKTLAVRVPSTDTTAQTVLPAAAQRSGKVIGFDSTGEDVTMYDTSDVVNTRAIQVPSSDTGAQVVLPAASSRISQVIGFDSSGENVAMYPVSGALTSVTVTHSMSPYTVTTANVIFVDASAGNVTINLPSAVTLSQIFISRLDNSYANVVTVVAQSGQTIVGSNTYLVLYQYQSNVFVSNGATAWEITSQFRKTSATGITNSYVSAINIFDVINDPIVIANIQARTLLVYLDSYIAAAIALGGMIFFPSGDYHFENPVTMAPGVEFCGAGMTNTVFYLAGNPGNWGFELLLPNGIQQIEAPKFRDIQFQVIQNGIRWNSITGGFTDDASSQQYMIRPMVERCYFNQDNTSGTGIALQLNKCFDFWIRGCQFSGFNYPMDFEGSDIGTVLNNRTDGTVTYEVLANSHNTFGSHLNIIQNDFNDPAITNINGGFISSSYRTINISDNHMESGSLLNLTNLIYIRGNDAFNTKIHRNQIDSLVAPVHWLRIDSGDNNKYLVSVFDNVTITNPTLMGNVSWGSGQPYFSNGGGRCLIRHGGNSNGDSLFPMNSDQNFYPPTDSRAAYVTASTPGVNYSGSFTNPICTQGMFQLNYDSDTGHYMEISDWNSYGLLNNQLIGTLTITVQTAAGGAGLVGSWAVLDGSTPVSSGTITHTNANQYYFTSLVSAHTFSTNAVVRFWNADGSAAERFFIVGVSFSL